MKIKHYSDAEKVAHKFIQLGKHFGMKIIADVNESLEPCGRGVGPFLEAKDVLSVLEQRPDRPLKLEAKALRLAGKLLDICYQDSNQNKNGEDEALNILKSGMAFKKFQEIVKAQGGRDHITFDSLKSKAQKKVITSSKSGKVKEINNLNLNTVAKLLGAPKDKYAGIYLLKHLDESVTKNEPVLEFYSDDHYKLREAEITLENFPIYQVQ
jgi:thymidine phosphorylase